MMRRMSTLRPVAWKPHETDSRLPGLLRLLDQTRLPAETVYLETADVEEIFEAIRMLRVRGAPAIGIAAAMGLAAVVCNERFPATPALLRRVEEVAGRLAQSRPTAVNLFWALERMRQIARDAGQLPVAGVLERLVSEAQAIHDEDDRMCRAIGRHGAALLQHDDTVLTHCNAGGLATSGYGTALAPIYTATEQGRTIHVIADETRPLLQGARLTAWELQRAGIDVTVICDNMAAQVMREGRVDCVMVGADRIAANGDAANKIGTYGVALLARAHDIPFYVLAPTSTIDLATPGGEAIPIEERGREEIACGFGRATVPDGVAVYAPAFDVTPAALITGIVTEYGIAPPAEAHAHVQRRPGPDGDPDPNAQRPGPRGGSRMHPRSGSPGAPTRGAVPPEGDGGGA